MNKPSSGPEARPSILHSRRDFLAGSLLGLGAGAGAGALAMRHLFNQEKEEADGAVQKNLAEWGKFEAIAEKLQERGCLVLWNHPKTGPTKGKFILTNSHIPHGGESAEPGRDLAIADEYRQLEFFVDEGLETFGLEGHPANKLVPSPNIIHVPLPEGKFDIAFLGDELDWKEAVREPGARRLTPDEVRDYFSDDNALQLYLSSMNGNVTGIAGGIFTAGYQHRGNVRCVGAEPPSGQAKLEQSIEDEIPLLKTFKKFQEAIKVDGVMDKGGNFRFIYSFDDETGVVKKILIGGLREGEKPNQNMEFPVAELEKAILWSLGKLDSQRERDIAREHFMVNELDTDVVLMGPGHFRNFLNMESPSYSLGLVIPRATRRFTPNLLDTSLSATRQGRFYLDIQRIKQEALERVRGGKQ